MQFTKNIILQGTHNRPISLDICFEKNAQRKPVLIYAHGFNGFKDWGNFDLVAAKFAVKGYVLVKFNFSHNGTTVQQPEEFADLEAFGNNNYSKELDDLGRVIDWVCDPLNPARQEMDSSKIMLVGHSMGGAICIIKSVEDKRIKKLVTWAGTSDCKTPWGNWPADKMVQWEQTGVQYYTNGRTKQQMPLYYQLYEDYLKNEQRFDIGDAIARLNIPVLICHGTMDTAVPVQKAFDLKKWQPEANLFTVESDHVFGRKHPWEDSYLPDAMEAVIEASIQFLK